MEGKSEGRNPKFQPRMDTDGHRFEQEDAEETEGRELARIAGWT